MRILILPFVCFFLMACAPGRAIDYNQQIQSWVGRDKDDLVRFWGPPDRFYTFKDNSSVIEYLQSRVYDQGWDGFPSVGYSHGGHGNAVVLGTTIGLGSRSIRTETCATTFKANKKGTITGAFFKGNVCRVPKAALQKL